MNLTIIIIQTITHAFNCAFGKSNVCGLHSNVYGRHSNANAFSISWMHLNAHLDAQHSNAYSNVFVNKLGSG